jgi:GDPmannose 4,6-dehydratase
MKKALITGVWGQDGSYLTEILVGKGYEVHGVARYPLSANAALIRRHLKRKGIFVTEHDCNLHSCSSVCELLTMLQPDEIYHLAASHYSAQRYPLEKSVADNHIFTDNLTPAAHLLEGTRISCPGARLVAAGSCLIFESVETSPQNEDTPCKAESLYGLAKILFRQMVLYYRILHGMHISMAILYNHESPRRSDEFVTRKIVKNLAAVLRGEINGFPLGSLTALKDWGYARDYVLGMWMMAQQESPDDYILASGEQHSVEEFVVLAADLMGIRDWRRYVKVGGQFITRRYVSPLVGDVTKARVQMGWSPEYDLRRLVKLMVDSELSGSLD